MSKKIVMVAFKPEATKSEVKEVLKQYPHKQVFNKKFDEATTDEEKILARFYSFEVEKGSEIGLINELKAKFPRIIHWAYQPSKRKLFQS